VIEKENLGIRYENEGKNGFFFKKKKKPSFALRI
jgi:hypothetical protein